MSVPVGAIGDRVSARGLGDIDARETVVVAATIAATVLAKVYWISRIGFGNPIAPVAEALGLSLFLVAAPLWITKAIRRNNGREWWTSQSVVTLACIALTVLAGVIAGRTGSSSLPGFAISGYALAIWTFVIWLRRGRVLKSLAFITGTGMFAVWCAGVIWGSRYKMPLFWETFTYQANVQHDTFYYSAIANMLDTYGVPTTGLDGIPVIHYHFGSPWLFAKWGHLLGVDVLSFYSLGYPVIVLPLFFSALLLLSVELRSAFGIAETSAMRSDWRVWIVFLAATVGFIPTRALDALAVWNSNAFISESYLIAMPVFMLLLGAGIAFWRGSSWSAVDGSRRAGGGGAGGSPRLSASLFLVVFLPAMLSIMGFLKVSQMLLPLGLAVYLFVRLRMYRRPLAIASIALSVIAVGLTYRIVLLPAQNSGISPLHFMRFDAAEGWQQFFPLIHLLWTWVYVAGRVWEEGVRDLRGLWQSIEARRLVDAETLAVIAVLGFLPGEIVAIHGGSAVYFSDAQRWLALSFIMARAGLWAKQWRASRLAKFPVHGAAAEGGLHGIRLSLVLAVFVGTPFVITLFVNLAQWPVRVARANVTLRRELISQAGGQSGRPRSLTDHALLARGEQRSAYYPIVTALRDISHLPASERKRMLLFIPQSNRQYWSMFTADGRCAFTPFIAPAVAGVAMIDGMPSNCQATNQYNMTSYQPRTHSQTETETGDAGLCAKAKAKGFSEVMVLDSPDGRIPHRRRIDCYLP